MYYKISNHSHLVVILKKSNGESKFIFLSYIKLSELEDLKLESYYHLTLFTDLPLAKLCQLQVNNIWDVTGLTTV